MDESSQVYNAGVEYALGFGTLCDVVVRQDDSELLVALL